MVGKKMEKWDGLIQLVANKWKVKKWDGLAGDKKMEEWDGEKKMKWMDGIAGKKIGNEKHGMDWLARQFDEREEFVGSAHGWIQPAL